MAMLQNFAIVKGGRNHMLKEGWLSHCPSLMGDIADRGKPKELPRTEALCGFLANFTFSRDGQVMMLRPPRV